MAKTYTSDELSDLADYELDIVVARTVMGWKLSGFGNKRVWERNGEAKYDLYAWGPTASWQHCGEVIERMLTRGALMTLGTNAAGFDLVGNHMGWMKNSPCRAICEAAVLATQAWRAGRRKGK